MGPGTGPSKGPCNDGALFIIHENKGYVVSFLSVIEKIVPVQAILGLLFPFSHSSTKSTLFRILQVIVIIASDSIFRQFVRINRPFFICVIIFFFFLLISSKNET